MAIDKILVQGKIVKAENKKSSLSIFMIEYDLNYASYLWADHFWK